MLVDCAGHSSADGGAQRVPGRPLWPDFQEKATLPDYDFTGLDFNCLGAQIGGKAVFFSMQKHDADDACEAEPSKWDFGNREHQGTVREAALRPCVFAGKGISPVAFDISNGILEHIGCAIEEKRPIHRVMHTENAVPTLHEGNIPKWTHNVILDRCKCAKPNRTSGMKVRCVEVQRDAFHTKPIPSDADMIALFLKIRGGEWHMEGLGIRDQLYGRVF